jgi:hypothetical protein
MGGQNICDNVQWLRIQEPMRKKVTGGPRKEHSAKLHDVPPSSNITGANKSHQNYMDEALNTHERDEQHIKKLC